MGVKLVSVMALLLLPAPAGAQPAAACPQPVPLSESQLADCEGARNTGWDAVAACGIDFDPTGEAIGRLRSAGAPETVLDAVRSATGPSERKRQAEQVLWESIKDSRDPAVFEDYLRRYPGGQFAETARQKFRDLKVAGMRAEMERTLAAGQWDAADGKVRICSAPSRKTTRSGSGSGARPTGREADRKRAEVTAALKAERDLWEFIKDSQDPQLFERFLKDHPASQYAGAAQSKVAALKLAAAKSAPPPQVVAAIPASPPTSTLPAPPSNGGPPAAISSRLQSELTTQCRKLAGAWIMRNPADTPPHWKVGVWITTQRLIAKRIDLTLNPTEPESSTTCLTPGQLGLDRMWNSDFK